MIPVRYVPHLIALALLVEGIPYCAAHGSNGEGSFLYGITIPLSLGFFVWRFLASKQRWFDVRIAVAAAAVFVGLSMWSLFGVIIAVTAFFYVARESEREVNKTRPPVV